MDPERWWPPVVDVVAVVWLGPFAVDVAAGYGAISLSAPVRSAVRAGLGAALVVFLPDLPLLYRWSGESPRAFVRSNWFPILTVVPWFRPLRLLRVGRGVRALRALAGARRIGAALNKVRRTGRRALDRFRR